MPERMLCKYSSPYDATGKMRTDWDWSLRKYRMIKSVSGSGFQNSLDPDPSFNRFRVESFNKQSVSVIRIRFEVGSRCGLTKIRVPDPSNLKPDPTSCLLGH